MRYAEAIPAQNHRTARRPDVSAKLWARHQQPCSRRRRLPVFPSAQPSPPPSSLLRPAQPNMVQLPLELYRSIFELVVDPNDLSNLCLASRFCEQEAERLLYRSINLGRDTAKLEYWALTMVESPGKAEQVKHLSITFDISLIVLSCMLQETLELVARALRALPNLTTLALCGHSLAMMNPVNAWMLDGCTFQLTAFHNQVFPMSGLQGFLAAQPKIREWRQADSMAESALLGAGSASSSLILLPRLLSLRCHSTLFANVCASSILSRHRPLALEELVLRLDGLSKACVDNQLSYLLATCGGTLKKLCLKHHPMEEPQFQHSLAIRLLKRTARHLDRLEMLIVEEPNAPSFKIRDYIRTLSKFSNLQGVLVRLTNGVHLPGHILQTMLSACPPNLTSVATVLPTDACILACLRRHHKSASPSLPWAAHAHSFTASHAPPLATTTTTTTTTITTTATTATTCTTSELGADGMPVATHQILVRDVHGVLDELKTWW